jgi:hypothetical protein
MLVLYPSNPMISQDRDDSEHAEEAKGHQRKTDSHKDADCIIEEIEDWQANRRKERGYG